MNQETTDWFDEWEKKPQKEMPDYETWRIREINDSLSLGSILGYKHLRDASALAESREFQD